MAAAEAALSVAANARDRSRKRKDFITAVKWSKYDKKEHIVLPPTYYPAFAILEVRYTQETEVVDVVDGHAALASMAVVDWFNFDPSLSMLSQDSSTAFEARAAANRLIHAALVSMLLYDCGRHCFTCCIVHFAARVFSERNHRHARGSAGRAGHRKNAAGVYLLSGLPLVLMWRPHCSYDELSKQTSLPE